MDFAAHDHHDRCGDESVIDEPSADAGTDYLPVLENVVAHLEDGLDHPEIWQLLSALTDQEVADLRTLTASLLDRQSGAVLKSLTVLLGILHALAGDLDAGLAVLDRLAVQHAHCVQVAGAQFYLNRLRDPNRTADLSQRFCDLPFTNFETMMDGMVSPCCSIWTQNRFGNLDNENFDAIWNSESAQSMRANILDGSFAQCNKQRCTYIMEESLPLRDEITDPGLRKIIDEGTTMMTAAPARLGLAHDVTCNLACPSCRDGLQIANDAEAARFDLIEHQIFRPLLDSGGAKVIALSGQGDPWSSPHYRSILRYMADTPLDIDLELHSNALLMGPRRWQDYAGLDRYRAMVNISIDSCTPWAYAVIRRPGRWEVLLPNLQFIAQKRKNGDFGKFHLNATIQLDNYHEMPAMVDFADQLGADTMRMYMIQQTGSHLQTSYTRLNVAGTGHPLHTAFLETLRDERLASPTAHLYDVATWRTRSFEQTLPSDSLPTTYSLLDLHEALREAHRMPERVVALCAAGRTRFRDDLDLLLIEANALAELGFSAQAQYRLNERTALGGEAITLRRH